MFLQSKLLSSFQTGIFSELNAYKKQKLNEGKSIIDLSIGSPDLPPPDFAMKKLSEKVLDQNLYGYSLQGTKNFHLAVGNYYKENFKIELDVDSEILQVSGSQDGLTHIPMTILNPGDICLVPDPGYPAYEAGIKLAGAKSYNMPLKKENGFLPDLSSIPKEILDKAKMMFLNFPGNPIPRAANIDFFNEVVDFAKKNNIVVIHDFAYGDLVYEEAKSVSFLQANGAKEVGVEFHSLSKSYNLAGCRIAFAAGNEQIISGLSKLKSNIDYGLFLPIQEAATVALTDGKEFLKNSREIYRKRKDIMVNGLRKMGWDVAEPDAAMFIWAEIPQKMPSKNFAYELMDQAGIVVTPGSAFGMHGEGFVRIALVHHESLLEEAVMRLQSI